MDKIEVTDYAWLRRELTPHGNGTWVGAIMTNIDLAIATARAEGHRAGMIEAAGIAKAVRPRLEKTAGRKGRGLNQIDEHVASVCDQVAAAILAAAEEK